MVSQASTAVRAAAFTTSSGRPLPTDLEDALAVTYVELGEVRVEHLMVAGSREQLDELPADLAGSTGHKDPHGALPGRASLRGPHHQRLSLYQAKVRSSASGSSFAGDQPSACTFDESML